MAECSGRDYDMSEDDVKLLELVEGLEQEEREQGEGRAGQQAGQGQPVEAGDRRE